MLDTKRDLIIFQKKGGEGGNGTGDRCANPSYYVTMSNQTLRYVTNTEIPIKNPRSLLSVWDHPHVNFGGGGGTSPALVIGVIIFIICLAYFVLMNLYCYHTII